MRERSSSKLNQVKTLAIKMLSDSGMNDAGPLLVVRPLLTDGAMNDAGPLLVVRPLLTDGALTCAHNKTSHFAQSFPSCYRETHMPKHTYTHKIHTPIRHELI
jgi:hypothetical protein